jgi:hypothetical protein
MPQGKGEIFWLPMLLLLTQLHKLTQIVSSTMLLTWLITRNLADHWLAAACCCCLSLRHEKSFFKAHILLDFQPPQAFLRLIFETL